MSSPSTTSVLVGLAAIFAATATVLAIWSFYDLFHIGIWAAFLNIVSRLISAVCGIALAFLAKLQPFMGKLEREVARLQGISRELVAIRDAICRPTPDGEEVDRMAETAQFAATLKAYRAWCAKQDASALLSLVRFMLIAMSSDTATVDPTLSQLHAKTSYAPLKPPAAPTEKDERNAA